MVDERMPTTTDGINFIHSFLVRPINDPEKTPPIGATVPLSGDLYDLLKIVFDKSEAECKIEIVFNAAADGSQNNEVREKLISILEEDDDPSRHRLVYDLAIRLLKRTNGVTGPGLLFVIGGQYDGHSKIMISRFPADEGIRADEQDGKLNVEFIGDLFMKNRNSYKAVVFDRLSKTSTRRTGLAVDKQVNDSGTQSSRYWIEEFLECQLAVSPKMGTERFANAYKKVYNSTKDLNHKTMLASAAQLFENFAGQSHTPRQLLSQLNIPETLITSIENELGPHAKSQTFELKMEYFKSSFRYQSKLIDNGVMITAEADSFDEIVTEKKIGDEIEFSTRGKVVNSKVQANRASGAM